MRGRVTGVGYRKWFGRRARQFGLTGYVKNASRKRVEAVVSGPADAVSALGYLSSKGPTKSVITSVAMTRAERPESEEFRIIQAPPCEAFCAA
ncbi:acylphosphatase [Nesterenkonia sp. NBAIMH1]|uniref:acylphosphatase n=1 Tax=Nesterenkonia sp. NBAIMH1 TaxID=2600320 RepID=UPI0011B7BD9A